MTISDLYNGSSSKAKKDKAYRRRWPWFSALALFFICFGLTISSGKRVPTPKPADTTPLDQFSEGRALKHINFLASLGPRLTGTYQNEVLATQYIVDYMRSIQKTAPLKGISMEIDVQRPSGCFNMFFVGFNYTNCYQNVTNVVVRLSAADPTKGTVHGALLVNAHYDTAAGSPGVSDDGAGVGIMMEIARAMAHGPPPPHAVVFLFNGAEESYLQASHGFISQHKWAKTLSAFINLESAGAGGKELVFQTGPGHSWLVDQYATSVPYPHATVVAQEIFQSGVVPGDTDFRVFRDYGHLPGLDLAYYANGYVYHTPLDNVTFVEPGAVQHCGDNVFEAVKAIVASDALAEPFAHSTGGTVYYDVMGLFTIVYTAPTALLLNSIAACMGVAYLLLSGHVIGSLVATIGFAIASVCCVAVCLALGELLRAIGASMVWYAHPWLLIGLFGLPGTLAVATVVKMIGSWASPEAAEEMSFGAHVIVALAALLSLTWKGLGSAYVPLHWIFWPVLTRVILGRLAGPRWRPTGAVIGSAVPLLLGSQLLSLLFVVFIPIFGRSGEALEPDLVTAGLVATAVATTTSSTIGLVHLDPYWTTVTVPLLIATSLISWATTSLLFSFSEVRPKRFFLQQILREFQPSPNSAEPGMTDYGYLLTPCDKQGLRHMTPYLKEEQMTFSLANETNQLGDMLPWYLPLDSVYTDHTYTKGPKPELPRPLASDSSLVIGPNEKLIKTEHGPLVVHSSTIKACQHDGSVQCRRLAVRAYGPAQMTLLLSKGPRFTVGDEGSTVIKSWSMGPVYADSTKPYHFVFMAGGDDPTVWSWWVEVAQEDTVEFTLSAHYFDTRNYTTAASGLLQHFPDWASAVSWSSHISNYTL